MDCRLQGVIVARHGEGTHNTGGFYSSDPDHPNYIESRLTELGREQALNLASQLKQSGIRGAEICRVVVSPLPRTIETAHIVLSALGVPEINMELDERVIESKVGDREGQQYKSYNDRDFWFPENPEKFGGETNTQIQDRMLEAYNQILTEDCQSEGYVMVFSHGAPIYLLIEALLGMGIKLSTAGYKRLPCHFRL
ncbi:histidine phosphatase family protein [Endozoicomonas arenosclerae]|uniref:histidine phosphatase family protein n=1 Tax=Endozoicomonas arenosclerae TaxID=1633495 RepID=UPI000780EF2A|nr:histidine phosphatase family protein [Endozoicomonas arenosclerae]